MTIYLKYDGELKYSTDDINFSPMNEETITGGNSGEAINWIVSQSDIQLTKIKIKDLNKKDGVILPGGSWKDTWEVKPKNVNNKECTGTPLAPEATQENPAYFAYDVQYNVQDGPTQTLDPGIRIPQQ
ncbi:MAG: hypothetical protein JXQ90_18885 [Cyclobacteriaceae bacterium]